MESDAFTVEVAPHLPVLHRKALWLTQHQQAAEDLLQDTLERAFVKFDHYERGTNVRAWLLRIMKNLRINDFRDHGRQSQAASLDMLEASASYQAARQKNPPLVGVESVILSQLGEEAIRQAFDALPDEFRMVVLLADVEELAYTEIAAILDAPPGTVASRLFRGRRPLQRTLRT